MRLVAVDRRAAAEGLHPGQTLADARALVPYLRAAEAEPVADARALAQLADWCTRYTPWAAVDGAQELCLDISGCAHLFGGEANLLADLRQRLSRFGVGSRAAVADTPAAAWAWARYGEGITPASHEALLALPLAGLRLPEDTVRGVRRLGLETIDDVRLLPRGPLAARFGDLLLRRLDLLSGVARAPISPRRPPPSWRVRLVFADGIGRREDIDAALDQLLIELGAALEKSGQGARRLDLAFYRLDGTMQVITVGTSRATRDAKHLAQLFAEKLETVDPGFGIETMLLGAVVTGALVARQMAFSADGPKTNEALAQLVDRLRNRLGETQVMQLAPVASHWPERAARRVLSAPRAAVWPTHLRRPLRLLPLPEAIDTTSSVPDGPPRSFRWRRMQHRVTQAQGPERLAPEWWRDRTGSATRDYYCLEDDAGRRFWVYRDGLYGSGKIPAWYLHGLFA